MATDHRNHLPEGTIIRVGCFHEWGRCPASQASRVGPYSCLCILDKGHLGNHECACGWESGPAIRDLSKSCEICGALPGEDGVCPQCVRAYT